jgi:ribosomal protein uL13
MTEKIILDAEGVIFGRLCSFAAKKALEGNEIIIVNSEKAIMTGNKKNIIQKYLNLRASGGHSPTKRPKYTKIPSYMIKRGIRGMLPDHRKGIGKQALSKVKCYNDIPEKFKDQEMKKIHVANNSKHITLKELSEKL